MTGHQDDEVFRIVMQLVIGAAAMPGFTLELASFMQLRAAERVAALAGNDPFLQHLRAECAAHRDEVMHDPVAFRAWIAHLERSVVGEALRRNEVDR